MPSTEMEGGTVADWGEMRKNLPEREVQLLDLLDFSPQGVAGSLAVSDNKLFLLGPF